METKGRGQTRHASSYVFTLWYQRESNKIPQVFCGAAYLTKEKLITLDWCAQKIDEAIKEHNNLDYFRYSATVAPIENLNQKKLLEIKEVYVRQDVDSKPNLRGFAVIKVSYKIPSKSLYVPRFFATVESSAMLCLTIQRNVM